jgi:hypothetical protein
MRALEYVDGRNVIFDVRISDRDRARVPALVDELLAMKPDVVVGDAIAARMIRAKTTSIPCLGRLNRSGWRWAREEPSTAWDERDRRCAISHQQLRSRFEWLREPDPTEVATPPLYMAFDILYRNGRDLTARPLRERRVRLEDVVAGSEMVFPVRRLAPDE